MTVTFYVFHDSPRDKILSPIPADLGNCTDFVKQTHRSTACKREANPLQPVNITEIYSTCTQSQIIVPYLLNSWSLPRFSVGSRWGLDLILTSLAPSAETILPIDMRIAQKNGNHSFSLF